MQAVDGDLGALLTGQVRGCGHTHHGLSEHPWHHLLLGMHLVGLSEDVAAFLGIVVLVELGLRKGVQTHLHHHLLLMLLDMLTACATVHHHEGRVGRHGALEVHRSAHLAVPPSECPRVGTLLLLVLLHHDVGTLPGGG